MAHRMLDWCAIKNALRLNSFTMKRWHPTGQIRSHVHIISTRKGRASRPGRLLSIDIERKTEDVLQVIETLKGDINGNSR